jgi:hypothetical protein
MAPRRIVHRTEESGAFLLNKRLAAKGTEMEESWVLLRITTQRTV